MILDGQLKQITPEEIERTSSSDDFDADLNPENLVKRFLKKMNKPFLNQEERPNLSLKEIKHFEKRILSKSIK